jgi:pimeloyl-ACP methyl ester carboxylesterase
VFFLPFSLSEDSDATHSTIWIQPVVLPFVDTNRVFVFAHSVGPVEGAIAVKTIPIAGFVASETVGKGWFEYTEEMARSQEILLGEDYVGVENIARLSDRCTFLLEIDREDPRRIKRSHPECVPYIPAQGGEAYNYFQDLADVDLATAWKQSNIPVLVTYGSSDPLTSSEESLYLVNMINSFHPGKAQYLPIDAMSHHFDRQASQALALKSLMNGTDGPYMPEYLAAVIKWIRSVK